ncbi:MAG: hypothetical protein NVS4B10_22120 [Myxococcales bacterium]
MTPVFTRKKQIVSAPVAVVTLAAAVLAAGCHGGKPYVAPPPLKSTAMPAKAALKPWDPSKTNMSAPSGMALVGLNQVFVALANLAPDFSPNGPGLLVALTPNTGATTVIDLAGSTAPAQHACSNASTVKADSGKLYVTCTGSFADPTGPGRALVEVDAATLAVTRLVAMPPNFQPDAVAVAADRIWLGGVGGRTLFAVDRRSFTVINPANPVNVPCTDQKFLYIPDLEVADRDLLVLCASSNGEIARLDPATGAFKDKAALSGQPAKLVPTGDGRIAVTNSTSVTVSLVTVGSGGMTSVPNAIALPKDSDLEGIAARNGFLYVVASGTPEVVKIDLNAPGGPKVVAAVATATGSLPLSIVPLDDNQAVVSNSGTGEVIGVNFSAAK